MIVHLQAWNRHNIRVYVTFFQIHHLKLLEMEYKERLDITAFIKACSFFKDEGNAVTFTTLSDTTVRDQWLELELGTLFLS